MCFHNQLASIDCEFNDGIGWSIFKPSFSQATQFTSTPNENDGCEKPGCYVDLVTYGLGLYNFCRFTIDITYLMISFELKNDMSYMDFFAD